MSQSEPRRSEGLLWRMPTAQNQYLRCDTEMHIPKKSLHYQLSINTNAPQ